MTFHVNIYCVAFQRNENILDQFIIFTDYYCYALEYARKTHKVKAL